jgi:hypothetical protein
MKWIYYITGFTLWYTLFLYGLGFFDPIQLPVSIENLEAAKHFEPTLDSGLTAMECVSLQQQISIVEYRLELLKESIMECETLKKKILLELNTADLRIYNVKNALNTLAQINDTIVSLKNSVQSLESMLENMKNSFKHCLKI